MEASFDRYEDDPDFIEFLKALLGRSLLSGPALEVAKLAVARGVGELSKEQREVLKSEVIQAHAIAYCAIGNEPHTWETMAEAIEGVTGACGFCEDKAEEAVKAAAEKAAADKAAAEEAGGASAEAEVSYKCGRQG